MTNVACTPATVTTVLEFEFEPVLLEPVPTTAPQRTTESAQTTTTQPLSPPPTTAPVELLTLSQPEPAVDTLPPPTSSDDGPQQSTGNGPTAGQFPAPAVLPDASATSTVTSPVSTTSTVTTTTSPPLPGNDLASTTITVTRTPAGGSEVAAPPPVARDPIQGDGGPSLFWPLALGVTAAAVLGAPLARHRMRRPTQHDPH